MQVNPADVLSAAARARLARAEARAADATPPAYMALVDFVPRISPTLEAPRHLSPYAQTLEQACPSKDHPGGELVVVAAPPQHGKTELTIRAFLWWDTYCPGRRHAYITYNADRTLSVARSFWLLAEEAGYSPRGTLEEIELRGGTRVKFTAINGSMTGYAITGVCVVDDPIKGPVEAASPTIRRRCVEWFDSVAWTRRHEGTSFVIMATRWHIEDLSGVLAARNGWRYLNLKAIAEDEDDPLGRQPGEALWPGHKPAEFFDAERANVYWWAAMYQGQPRPRGGEVFREPARYSELPRHGYRVAYGLDLAYTARTHADYSVLVELWRVDTDEPKRPLYYVVQVDRKQVDAPSFTLTLKARHSERAAPMRWYASGPEKGSADFIQRQGLPIELKPPRGDKFVRAQPVAAAWNDGRVLVPDMAGWVPAFVAELTSFTGIADTHDDQVDALAAAYDSLDRAQPGRLLTVGARRPRMV